MARNEVLKEGSIVTLGQNMFSLPKRQWFTLRTNGLFYSARERGSRNETYPESLIEFETMYLRVEKIEDDNSKFSYRNEKVTVYCLRVGDKRKCRVLCFTSWEERDFWMISILTAIAQFKISGEDEFCGEIRCSTSSTLRSRLGKPASLRLARTSSRKSIRKRFTSLRSRKSMRDSRDGDFNENIYVKTGAGSMSQVFAESEPRFCNTVSSSVSTLTKPEPHSPTFQISERKFSELEETSAYENVPPSPRLKPWLFEKLSSTVDFGMKRHFSSFITKFT